MSKYNVPHTFIPGTKAKANEVNENFIAILDYISQTKDISADINFSNITTTAKETIYNNSSQGRLIGEIITSALPINDACVHLLDGAIISNTGVYKDFVSYIGKLYANATTTPAYFTTEEEWQNTVSTYGVCGKFVYNASTKTVRLPKITGIIEGTNTESDLGQITPAGLPNITGEFKGIPTGDSDDYSVSGAFTAGSITSVNKNGVFGDASANKRSIKFNAANSSAIYGKSSKVQPQSVKVYYYIVLAETTKTNIKIDLDNITTEINSKAETDLENINSIGTSNVANWAMPSDNYIELTVTHNGNYTAPANGYFALNGKDSTEITNYEFVLRNIKTRYLGISGNSTGQTAAWCNGLLPVKKNDSVGLYVRNITTDTHNFRFYYAKGSESEAQ